MATKFGSGAEAIQTLVDTRAQLKALRAWSDELAEWQRMLNTDEHKLVQRQKDALDYITTLAAENPEALGLSVSDTTVQVIETGEAMMNERFEKTKELVA